MIRAEIQKSFLGPNSEKLDLDFRLQIEKGEFVVLYGVSGAGKTSLIKMIAGLLKPDRGRIEVDGRIWFDSESKIDLPIRKRNLGFAFQENSLYPNLNVRENLEFALPSKNSDRSLLEELVSIMNIESLMERRIEGLSGGQKQRICLTRAVLRKPEYLFLDEPFSSLDRDMRFQLQASIRKLHKELQTTTILVSHEIPEIFKLSNKVFVIDSGKILRSGTPMEIFHNKGSDRRIVNTGEIVDIDAGGTLTVWAMNTLIRVESNESFPILRPGDKVEIEFDYREIKIVKTE
ncbi:hypothetical protein CH371_18485 [Leptospira wolffii]|uniref:ABC transporter domain-containing protein n=1 Tax=Leptospira wolffii TaxID=409998 RepID=A0A2M9Z7P2_9LEPT|nr:ATP-binding cassette domain-containing protein [Leptospira wolffii]PJZ64404.1 hypothetical protein CH371_18485 [Leptospira wolffii]